MGKRADTLLRDAGYRDNAPAALVALVNLACEKPGFDPYNYVSAAAYRSDARRAARGLRDVKRAVELAYVARVDNAALYEASRGARVDLAGSDALRDFNGPWRASYCAGQYYPTEYRGAIARVIESAARHMVKES